MLELEHRIFQSWGLNAETLLDSRTIFTKKFHFASLVGVHLFRIFAKALPI